MVMGQAFNFCCYRLRRQLSAAEASLFILPCQRRGRVKQRWIPWD